MMLALGSASTPACVLDADVEVREVRRVLYCRHTELFGPASTNARITVLHLELGASGSELIGVLNPKPAMVVMTSSVNVSRHQ